MRSLKEDFEFYIIPMLNIDGVINGNYRCSLAACDLNRKWISPSKILHPTVYSTKLLCSQLLNEQGRSFYLYLDMHGHSIKQNVFQYGNKLESLDSLKFEHQPKLFSLLLSKSMDCFSFSDCSFSMAKSKESTARITMFHELKIPFVFTLEASFAGASKGKLSGCHFSLGDLENIGKCVLKCLHQAKTLEGNRNLLKDLNVEIEAMSREREDQDQDSDGSSDDGDKVDEPALDKQQQSKIA